MATPDARLEQEGPVRAEPFRTPYGLFPAGFARAGLAPGVP